MKRWARWTVGIAIGLSVVVTALWQEENRRGKRIWEETCARLRAAGEPVEIADIIPPMIPDEENVVAAPIFAEVFVNKETARLNKYVETFGTSSVRSPAGGLAGRVGRPERRPLYPDDMSQLDEWRTFLRASLSAAAPMPPVSAANEIRQYYNRWEPEMREIREALQRPKCRWPLHYEAGLSMGMDEPGLSLPASACVVARPLVLATAQSDPAACADVLLTHLRLVRLANEGNTSIAGLSLTSMGDGSLLQSLQHVVSVAHFDAAQLTALQDEISRINLRAAAQVFRCQRVALTDVVRRMTIKEFREMHQGMRQLPFDSAPEQLQKAALGLRVLALGYRPEGWRLADMAGFENFMHDEVEPCVNESAGTILRSRVSAMASAAERIRNSAGKLSLLEQVPRFDYTLLSEAKHQVLAREALLWCAIERFRLKHGRIPDKLDELVAEFVAKLPCDPVDGMPLRYVRKGENDYLLYSIGWNGVDDGGVESKRDRGDWVWASDPRLIVNPEEEKKKADEVAQKKREADWKVEKAKREAAFKAKEETNKRERAKAATGAASK